jgi:MerR family mercuric resistance operon transcriptional regulator
MSQLTIGRLAQAASVNVETIRYYQRVGLVREPGKPAQGFRRYPEDTIDQIKFIKRAQQLGFSLKEISELLILGKGHCKDVRKRAEAKRDRIESQIKDLEALRSTLTTLIKACHSGKGKHACPIVETLSREDTSKK